jgi:hypothetical protein
MQINGLTEKLTEQEKAIVSLKNEKESVSIDLRSLQKVKTTEIDQLTS